MASRFTNYRREVLRYFNSRATEMIDETFCREYRIQGEELSCWVFFRSRDNIIIRDSKTRNSILDPRYIVKGFRYDKDTIVIIELTARQKKRNTHEYRKLMNADYPRMRVLQTI